MMRPVGELLDAMAAHYRPRTREQMREAVHELAREGYGDHDIAHVSGLSVEAVRRFLAEHVRRPR